MSKYDGDKFGTQLFETKAIKLYYIILKLLSDEGLNNREAQHELGCSDKTIYRLIGSCKESFIWFMAMIYKLFIQGRLTDINW